MNIKELIENPEKIKEIKDLELLKTLIQEGKEIIKPYEDIIYEMRKQSDSICKVIREEERKNRVIKNFKVLENLIADLDDIFKPIILDIDELLLLVGKGGHPYFTRADLENMFECNNVNPMVYRADYEKILNFLTENNLLVQMYEYLCSRCHDTVLTMKGKPTEETLRKHIEDYCGDIDEFFCDECEEGLEFTLKYIQPTMYYAKPDKEEN